MQEHIIERVIDCADYVIRTQETVRETARRFGVSKSTVHKDLRGRLPKIDTVRYGEVDKVLEANMAVRHIRGGEATRKRFLNMEG